MLNGPTAMPRLLDDAFRALAHPERRQLLRTLAAHHPQPDQSPQSSDDVTVDLERHGVDTRISMHHRHLPLLEAAGFIDRSEDDQLITRGPNFEVLRPYLQAIEEMDLPGGTDGR